MPPCGHQWKVQGELYSGRVGEGSGVDPGNTGHEVGHFTRDGTLQGVSSLTHTGLILKGYGLRTPIFLKE